MPTIAEQRKAFGILSQGEVSLRPKTSIERKIEEPKPSDKKFLTIAEQRTQLDLSEKPSFESHNQIDNYILNNIERPMTLSEQRKRFTSVSPGLPQEEEKALFNLLDKKEILEKLGKTGTQIFGNKHVQAVMKTLMAGENASVASLRYLSGLPAKKTFQENTTDDLFLDLGAPNNLATKSVAFIASVFLDPLTYVSFGTSRASKSLAKMTVGTSQIPLLFKGAEKALPRSLSNFGRKQFNKQVKELSEQSLKTISGEVTEEVSKKITLEAQDTIVKKFKNLAETTNLSVKEGFLRRELFDRGGIKFAGRTLLNGEDVLKALDKSGIMDIWKKLMNTDVGQYVLEKGIQPLKKASSQFRDSVGRLFIPNYSSDKKLMDFFDTAKREASFARNSIIRETNELFEGLSQKQIQEFSDIMIETRALNLKEGIKSVSDKLGSVPKSVDSKVQSVIDKWIGKEGQEGIIQSLAKESGVGLDEAEDFYFPFIKENAEVIADFKPQNAKRMFLEEATGALAHMDISRDPIHAIAVRRTQIAFANIQDELYANFLKEHGVEQGTKTVKQMLDEGFIPATKFSYKGQVQKSFLFGDPNLYKKVNDKTFFVPKRLWDDFNNAFGYANTKIPVISYATNLWKAGVTTSPAFHFRNASSNVFLNSLSIGGHALSPTINAKAMKAIWANMKKASEQGGKFLERTITTEQGQILKMSSLLKEAKDHNILRSGIFYDMVGDDLPSNLRKAKQAMQTTWNPLDPKFKLYSASRNFGNIIENQARLTNFIANRIKGLDPSMAARAADDALFDYQNITKTEQWLKNLIPFYVFNKKFTELAIKTAAQEPGKIANYLKFARIFGPSEDEWKQLPDWAKNRATLKFGNLITTGFGLPMENFIQLADDPGGEIARNLNPLMRYGLEKMTGRDFFTQRRLDEITSAQEFKFAFDILKNPNIADAVKAPVKKMVKFLDLKEHTVSEGPIGEKKEVRKISINPNMRHVLQNMFTSRWMSEFKFLTDEEKTNLQFASKALLGIISLDLDEKHIFFRNRKAQEASQSELRKGGYAYTFEKAVLKPGILPKFKSRRIYQLEKKVKAFPEAALGEISSDQFKIEVQKIIEEK